MAEVAPEEEHEEKRDSPWVECSVVRFAAGDGAAPSSKDLMRQYVNQWMLQQTLCGHIQVRATGTGIYGCLFVCLLVCWFGCLFICIVCMLVFVSLLVCLFVCLISVMARK